MDIHSLGQMTDPRMVAGLGVGGALLYKIWRVLKADARSDRQDSAVDKFYEDLKKQLEVVTLRADTFAQERNTAVANAAKLQVEVDVLNSRLTELRDEISRIATQLSASQDSTRELIKDNSSLRARVEVYELQLNRVNPLPAPSSPPSLPLSTVDSGA